MSLLEVLLSNKRDYTQMLCVPFHSSSWFLSVEGRDHNILVWLSKLCIIIVVFMVKVILYLYFKNKSNQTRLRRNTLSHSHCLKQRFQALEQKLSDFNKPFLHPLLQFLLFITWSVS